MKSENQKQRIKMPVAKPISLAPLSFEDAVRALAATPPMREKPKRQPAPRRRKQPNREKAD